MTGIILYLQDRRRCLRAILQRQPYNVQGERRAWLGCEVRGVKAEKVYIRTNIDANGIGHFRVSKRPPIFGRNHLDLAACLREVYQTELGLANSGIPNDPELPLPLDKVHPLHEVVKVDYFLPGCPPSADAIWKFLTDLLAGHTPQLGHGLIHYD